MSERCKFYKHGKLSEFVRSKWNHALAHLVTVESLQSIRKVANVHGIQFRSRTSTIAGYRWVFLRPKEDPKP